MRKIYLLTIFAAVALVSCQEESIGSIPLDSIAPGVVTDVKVENIPGGANISYTMPDDEDLLYVKAVYKLESGKDASVMTSMYGDTLKIRGFAHERSVDVKIISCDRSGNQSAPVIATINPKRSPIFDIMESLKAIQTFGGVQMSWENATKEAVAVTLLRKVGSRFEDVITYYSDSRAAKQSARGLENEETEFGVFIKDRWDNYTDTTTFILTPLFEEQFPVGTYKKYKLAGDSDISYGWDLGYALDGDLTQPWGWFSKPTVEGGTWPAKFTVTIPGGAMLSRVRIVQRHPEMWENGNPKKFYVLGSNEPSNDGSEDSWTFIKEFTSVKPSGLPSGQYSDEDTYIAENGEDFEFDAENLADYEYFRFVFTENWGGDNTWINLYEVLFYGKLNSSSK